MRPSLIIYLAVLIVTACIPNSSTGNPPDPAVAPTSGSEGTNAPNQYIIVDAFNKVLRDADPLGNLLDAEFHVIELKFDKGNTPVDILMRISVECEWIYNSSCTPERGFVVLIHALEKAAVSKAVIPQIPTYIEKMDVTTFNRMQQIGMITVCWKDVLAYLDKKITGEQLSTRVKDLQTCGN